MENIEDLPNSFQLVPPLRRGLYRRDNNEYIDGNNWIIVGNVRGRCGKNKDLSEFSKLFSYCIKVFLGCFLNFVL